MPTDSVTPLRYSTVATIELVVNQTSYDVAALAGDFLRLRQPTDIAVSGADLYIRFEGEEEIHRRIRLPEGASVESPRVVIEREIA